MNTNNKIKWHIILAPIEIDPAFVEKQDELHCFVFAENCDEAADRAIIKEKESYSEFYVLACYPV